MIKVEKIWEGIRDEGLNYGLPTTFLKLGPGPEYNSEELVKDILMKTRCKWVCILGESTTQIGIGTLVKGLSTVGMYIEVEVSGTIKDPGWLHTVDRWLVDYVKDSTFNYGALRTQDMIRFVVAGRGDLNFAKSGFEDLRLFLGTKYLKLVDSELENEAFALVRSYERSRLYGFR